MTTSHDSRWSSRRNMRQEDHRHDYGGGSKNSSRQLHYEHYDPYDSTGEGEYGSREYPDGYEQSPDLYENVPARNIARIQITAEEEENRHPRFRDYEQHTIDRPYKGDNERRMESARRVEPERNAEKSSQAVENRRREEIEKARRADMERQEEKRKVEVERQRQIEERKRQEHQRKQQQLRKVPHKREPHLRYEPSPVPFQGHKQGIIDGFQTSPNKQKNNYEDDYRPQGKKNEIPPAPPAPKSIKAIINNLKGGLNDQKVYNKDDGRNDIPRNKQVSTNPFVRAGDKPPSSPARTPETHAVKNVQEVVQKMNSGEWPIRVEDEEHMSRPRSQQAFEKNHKNRQWEELDRHSPNPRRGSVRDMVREADEEQRRHDSEFSERSDGAEVTTVSTDSAIGADDSSYLIDKHQLPFELPHGTVIRKLPGNVMKLNEDAEKLLLYFKGHRNVLNYLGIGLSETLWSHIHALPETNAEIIISRNNSQHSSKKGAPQITVTQPIVSPKHHEQTSPERRLPSQANSRPSQSPRMNALERQLCTDAVSPPPPSIDEQLPRIERSGRFVKKSAAALIARKQGAVIQLDEEPLSCDFMDNRIAAEIEQLRMREEELKRSRSQLGLPTIDDMVEGWKGPQPYFDYQRQMPISRSQSAHNIYNDNHSSPNMNYFQNQREEYDETASARVQRLKEIEQKFERGEQFFRSSETQLRQRSAISRMDIAVLSPGRPSSPPRRSGQIGL